MKQTGRACSNQKTKMKFFLLKSSLVKKFHFGFLTPASKLLRSQQPMGTKVEEEDPSDLLPKVVAEKMIRRLLRGCQLEVF